MPEKKPKREIARRSAAGEKRWELPEREPRERDTSHVSELLNEAHKQQTPPPPTTSSNHLLPPPTKSPTAPERDFTRVPNSINRVLPSGLFKGTSKKTYDVLYQRTRGAIKPEREIQIRHSDLRDAAKVSHNTLREHLRHLEAIHLVVRKWELGDNAGATYEIFIPEEVGLTSTSYHPLPPPPPTTSSLDQKLVGPSYQKLVGGGGGQVPEESMVYVEPKTIIKTKDHIDDESHPLIAKFLQAERELTGKISSADKWADLAELLVTELKIAAGRTTVSNVPAFLTEHLRRRLWKVDKNRAMEIVVESEEGSASPLTDEQRKQCPDCSGTNFWYPDGPDKGVARCTHQKLHAQNDKASP